MLFKKGSVLCRSKIPYCEDNYIHPSGFISVFLHPFVKCGPQDISKPLRLPVLCAGETSSGLTLTNGVPREEWWDNNPTVLNALWCWCILEVFWLCDHAISGCYHPPVSHDSFSLQDFWDFSIWALTLPISEADGIFTQLKFSMAVTDIRSLESGIQHTSLSPY